MTSTGGTPTATAPSGAPGTGAGTSGRIVTGVDGSPGSAVALAWALAEGALRHVPVHVVLTWALPATVGYAPMMMVSDVDMEGAARSALDAALSGHGDLDQRPSDSPVTTEVVEGNAAHTLLDASRDAGLLVVGTRGHGGFAGLLLGSVSQQVVAHATCPVVVVHQPAHDAAAADRGLSTRRGT